MRKSKNTPKIVMLLFVSLLAFPAGCKKKEVPPPPQPAPEVKHEVKPVPPVQNRQSSAQIIGNAGPLGDFSGKKDPFKPYVVETKAEKTFLRKSSSSGLLPIQNYEVGQFRALGIVAGLHENKALVVDPAGKAYVVKPGMEIGKNGGEIEKITATSIEVVERYRDENGKVRKRTVRLSLPRKE